MSDGVMGQLREVGGEVQGRVSTWVAKPAFWLAFLAVVTVAPVLNAWRFGKTAPTLPVLGTVPAFELVDQHGQPYGSEQLRGRVWVADFMFTRCPTVCPILTERMGEIQNRTRFVSDVVQLVSFTVDPEHDTPEVLADYAREHRTHPYRWTFLTGSRQDVEDTARGMKIAAGFEGDERTPASIFHGEHFVLVDAQLRVRGYYNVTDGEKTQQLLQHVGVLANGGGGH